MNSRLAWLLVGIAFLALTSLAAAATTQTVDDKQGDSTGPVDIKRVKVTQDGRQELSFTIWAYETFRTRKSPCVFVYKGSHDDPGNDGYSIGCFGKVVSADGEPNGELERTRPSRKSVKYTLDPRVLDDPAEERSSEFRWQAVAGARAGIWDKAPRRPKTFDGSNETTTDPGNPQGPCYPLC